MERPHNIAKTDNASVNTSRMRSLTEPLLDNFKAAGTTVCMLTPEASQGFAAKVKPVWEAFAKKAPGNKAILATVLAAKKEFATQKK